MILRIEQTRAGTAQTFDVYTGDRLVFTGRLGAVSKRQEIVLEGKNGQMLTGTYLPAWELQRQAERWKLPGYRLSQGLRYGRAGQNEGCFFLVRDGLWKSRYVIANGGESFSVYFLSKGSFEYLSIYRDERQIALVEHYLTVVDNRERYKLYLLEEYRALGETLTLFLLYFDNWNHAERFPTVYGTRVTKAWSLSRYAHTYDPGWRAAHFPQENFFGKSRLFPEDTSL